MSEHQTEHRHESPGKDHAGRGAGAIDTRVTDPVCGMKVDPAASKHRADYGGKTFHFCSAGCRAKFIAAPESYLRPQAAASEPAKPGSIYTCPMHPQIRQVGPGSCPICGMALEPVEATADAGPNHELADMTRRFWIGLALTLPVFILEMAATSPASACTASSLPPPPPGFSSPWRRPSCCGRDGRSSSAARRRSAPAT